ncbi:MAG: hypothetical protein ACREMP_04065 [Candidatus Tyrphobacter sp.]
MSSVRLFGSPTRNLVLLTIGLLDRTYPRIINDLETLKVLTAFARRANCPGAHPR